MLIDSHCHLSELSPEELTATIQQAKNNGVDKLIAIGAGYGFDDNLKTLNIFYPLTSSTSSPTT